MIELIQIIVFLLIGFFIGGHLEAKHFASIRSREAELLNLPVRVGQTPKLTEGQVRLVTGSVVVASDYFKTFVANIKTLFGGRLTTYEALLDRARREAIIRMKLDAVAWGAREVVAVELNTTFIDQLGVEVTAVGTAIKS